MVRRIWPSFRFWKLIEALKHPVGTAKSLAALAGSLFRNSEEKREIRPQAGFELSEWADIQNRSKKRSHLSDHLVTLFAESLSVWPRLIVELGVGNGESTFVLERVARLCGSKLVSVDIEDCSGISSYSGGVFVQSDDVEFARRFEVWCRQRNIEPIVDVLFIDTSHLFEHTGREIESWFPHLAERSKVFFHDTNLKKVCFRKDGGIAFAWDNQRGVIRAIEQFLGKAFNEEKDFVEVADGWLVKHYACCAGFTILERVGSFK